MLLTLKWTNYIHRTSCIGGAKHYLDDMQSLLSEKSRLCGVNDSNGWQWRPISLPLISDSMTFSKVMLDVVKIDKQEKRKNTSFSNLTTSSVMFLKGKCYRWGTEKKQIRTHKATASNMIFFKALQQPGANYCDIIYEQISVISNQVKSFGSLYSAFEKQS